LFDLIGTDILKYLSQDLIRIKRKKPSGSPEGWQLCELF